MRVLLICEETGLNKFVEMAAVPFDVITVYSRKDKSSPVDVQAYEVNYAHFGVNLEKPDVPLHVELVLKRRRYED